MPLFVVESVIETGHWNPATSGNGPSDWIREGEHTTLDTIVAPSLAVAQSKARKYARLIRQTVRKPTPADYHDYEVREGDGNSGTYRQGTVSAIDMEHAIRLARREYLHTPRRGLESEGDDIHALLCTYGRGDYCPYVAEIIDIAAQERAHKAIVAARLAAPNPA